MCYKMILLGILLLHCFQSFSERNEMIIVSDTHFGDPLLSTEAQFSEFMAFLAVLTNETTPVHTLVLNGDIIDLWAFPYNEIPPYPDKAFETTDLHGENMKIVVEALKKVIENNIRVLYIRGNHDIFMEKEYLSEIGLSSIEFYKTVYEGENFEIHHGHEYNILNNHRPDGIWKPFSYYLTRSIVQHGTVNSVNDERRKIDIWQYFCDLFLASKDFLVEIEDERTFYVILLNYCFDNYDFVHNPEYEKHRHDPIFGGDYMLYNEKNTTLHEIVDVYKNSIKVFIKNLTLPVVEQRIRTDFCRDYTYYIKKAKKKLFIMGHTHKPGLEIVGETIYANSGCWLKKSDYNALIRVYQKMGEAAESVELCSFVSEGSSIHVIKRFEIPQ